MQNFNLVFEEVDYHSLSVELLIGQETINIYPSNLRNDPIEELTDSVLHILSYPDPANSLWFQEPGWHSLVFKPILNSQELEITLYYYCDQEDFTCAERTITTTASTIKVCRCIASSLRKLIHEFGRDFYESDQGWNYKFPEQKVAIIYSEIKRKRNNHHNFS